MDDDNDMITCNTCCRCYCCCFCQSVYTYTYKTNDEMQIDEDQNEKINEIQDVNELTTIESSINQYNIY